MVECLPNLAEDLGSVPSMEDVQWVMSIVYTDNSLDQHNGQLVRVLATNPYHLRLVPGSPMMHRQN